MIKEIKAWVAKLEATINELAQTYNKPVEEVEEAWERFWYEDGPDDENWEGHSIEVFKKTYKYLMEEENEED